MFGRKTSNPPPFLPPYVKQDVILFAHKSFRMPVISYVKAHAYMHKRCESTLFRHAYGSLTDHCIQCGSSKFVTSPLFMGEENSLKQTSPRVFVLASTSEPHQAPQSNDRLLNVCQALRTTRNFYKSTLPIGTSHHNCLDWEAAPKESQRT